MRTLLPFIDIFSDKLISEGGPWHPDSYHPLHRACWGRSQKHTETVKVLLDFGMPWDTVTKDTGKTCLDMTSNDNTRKLLEMWKEKEGKKAKGEL